MPLYTVFFVLHNLTTSLWMGALCALCILAYVLKTSLHSHELLLFFFVASRRIAFFILVVASLGVLSGWGLHGILSRSQTVPWSVLSMLIAGNVLYALFLLFYGYLKHSCNFFLLSAQYPYTAEYLPHRLIVIRRFLFGMLLGVVTVAVSAFIGRFFEW